MIIVRAANRIRAFHHSLSSALPTCVIRICIRARICVRRIICRPLRTLIAVGSCALSLIVATERVRVVRVRIIVIRMLLIVPIRLVIRAVVVSVVQPI